MTTIAPDGSAPKKSPLRINKQESPAAALLPRGLADEPIASQRVTEPLSAEDLRQLSIKEFAASLREGVSKRRRPYQEHTITNYADAAPALDRRMTASDVDGDFTECDTATLSRFFADYLKAHTQGGTNTLQRNLAHLFEWLEEACDHPSPYSERLHRYAPEKKRPATLAEEFIKDMFEVTGGGRARGFEDVRDHAIFKVFTEGARRTEVAQMEVDDLSADLHQGIPNLKGPYNGTARDLILRDISNLRATGMVPEESIAALTDLINSRCPGTLDEPGAEEGIGEGGAPPE